MTAMREEWESLMKNGTFKIVPRPHDAKLVKSKWVYKIKTDENNLPVRFKARLVARGYSQRYGVDYFETFAPVARKDTIRVGLCVANSKWFKVHQMDVDTAFLVPNVEEEIYMEQPQGFIDAEHPDYVLKVEKSLYGLKQASKAWYDELKNFIVSIGFTQSAVDPCLFINKKNDAVHGYIIIYVDYLILCCDETTLSETKNQFKQKFPMKDLDEIKWCLGLNIQCDKNKGTMTLN